MDSQLGLGASWRSERRARELELGSGWLQRGAATDEVRWLVGLAVVGAAALGLASRQKCNVHGQAIRWTVPLLAPVAGLLFWFLTAPDVRFGLAYIWPVRCCCWLAGYTRSWQGA